MCDIAGRPHRELDERVHNAIDDGGGGAGQHVQRRDRHRLVVLRGARRVLGGAGRAQAGARAARHGHQPPLRQLRKLITYFIFMCIYVPNKFLQ